MIANNKSPLTRPMNKNLMLIAIARIVLFLVGQFFIVLNHVFFSIDISMFWAQICLALLLVSAVLDLVWQPEQQAVHTRIRYQLISDVVILTLLFHATGGAVNPFVSILLFPLVISTSILNGKFNWFMVFFTLLCYGSLFFASQWSPSSNDLHAHHMHASMQNELFSLHIIGMWFNFAISAVLISVFVVRMRQVIDQQQLALHEQKEQALRDEQLLAIATQAASAAHHLGTPLSTMSVILHDLELASLPDSCKEELELLNSQVEVCKRVLTQLKGSANKAAEVERVGDFVNKLLDEFRLLQPSVHLEVDISSLAVGSCILADSTLRMSVLNILKNAADASPDHVIFNARTQAGVLLMEITDFGAGFADDTYFLSLESTKEDGLGIGLFISHATLKRYGGTIQLVEQSHGAQVNVSIPLCSDTSIRSEAKTQ